MKQTYAKEAALQGRSLRARVNKLLEIADAPVHDNDIYGIIVKTLSTRRGVLTCPNCSSQEWKLASLIYREGLHHVNTQTSGGGVGLGTGGVGVGVGGSTTTGTHQSELSAAASPPGNPAIGISFKISLGVAFLCFLYGWLIRDSIFAGLFFSVVGIFLSIIPAIIIATQFTKERHEEQMAAWSKVRMCLRCGNFYTPTENLASEPLQNFFDGGRT